MKKWLKRTAIASGLVAVLAAATFIHQGTQIILPRVTHEQADLREENKKKFHEAVIAYQREFYNGNREAGGGFEGYVDLMTKAGAIFNPIRKNIGHFGREKVVQTYTDFQRIPLDWVFNNDFRMPTPEEKAKIGLEMLSLQSNNSIDTYINFKYAPFQAATADLAENRIGFWNRLWAANSQNPTGFDEMVKRTFTEKGFEKEILDYQTARQNYYKKMAESLTTYSDKNPVFQGLVRKVGPGIALIYMNTSDAINRGEVKRIYNRQATSLPSTIPISAH